MSGGKPATEGPLAVKRELREAQKKLEKVESELSQAEINAVSAARAIEEAVARLELLNEQRRQAERDAANQGAALKQMESEVQRIERRLQEWMLQASRNKDAREVAPELGVRYLLEGSVRRLEHRVRINAQLVEAAHGQQVWGERYDRELEDIFGLQDDVTRRIVDSLEVHLSEAESKTLIRTDKVNVEAYDLLLCGLERFWKYTIESVDAAHQFFIKALEVDPNYAMAHAWLARACLQEVCS